MSKEERFNQIYQQIVDTHSDDMELERKAAKKENRINRIIFVILALIALIIYCVISNLIGVFSGEIASLFFMVVPIIYTSIKHRGGKSKIEKYANDYKEIVISTMVKAINQKMDFTPTAGVAQEVYNEADFEKYDRYHSEDLVKGDLNKDYQFEMSEVLTEDQSATSGTQVKYTTKFSGLFAKVATPKPFNDKLYIREDIKEQGFFTRLFSGKFSFDNLRVKFEEQEEFEKMFDVYCSNSDIAFRLIKPDIMQILINFEKEMKIKYEITIKNSFMYIRFKCGKMFEVAKLKKYSLDRDTLFEYFSMIDFTFDLTNKLMNILNEN